MSMFRRGLLAMVVVLVVVIFAPSQLAAEERESPAGARISASVLDWISAAWSGVTSWFADPVEPPRPTWPNPTTDGGCEVDPDGKCLDRQ